MQPGGRVLTQHAQVPGCDSERHQRVSPCTYSGTRQMDKYSLSYKAYLLLHPLTSVLRPTKIPFHQVHFLKMHFVQWPDLAFVQSLPVKLLLPFKKNYLKPMNQTACTNSQYKRKQSVYLLPFFNRVSLTQFGE